MATSDTTQTAISRPVETPDRDWDWKDELTTTGGGLDMLLPDKPDGAYLSLGGGASVQANQVAYVPTGADAYIEEYADAEVEVPAYYNRFDDFTRHIGKVDTRGRYGKGISARRLEAVVRVATGGGRYSADDIEVYSCGARPFIVRSGDGTFAARPESLRRPQGMEDPTTTVAGMEVAAGTETVKEGIVQAKVSLATHLGIEITGYNRVDHDGTHYFETDEGELKVPGYVLARLARIVIEPAALVGEKTYESPWDETYSYELTTDDFDHEVGDDVRKSTLVGYQFGWSDPRTTSRVSMSGRVKPKLYYVRLSLSDHDPAVLECDRKSDSLDRFKTRNKDHNPLAV